MADSHIRDVLGIEYDSGIDEIYGALETEMKSDEREISYGILLGVEDEFLPDPEKFLENAPLPVDERPYSQLKAEDELREYIEQNTVFDSWEGMVEYGIQELSASIWTSDKLSP